MYGKQKGFTLIEILVVVTIIGVLAGLVVVLIPKGKEATIKVQCQHNITQMVGLLEVGSQMQYPEYSGPNLLLYLVNKGDLEGEDNLKMLFCPGDQNESLKKIGGEKAYKDIDLNKRGEYGAYTSYACRDQRNGKCAAKMGASKPVVLVCDDSEDHHFGKGFVVGLTGGAAKWRDKVDDWGLNIKTSVVVGESSEIPELKCLRVE